MTFREILVRVIQNGRFVAQNVKLKTKKVFASSKTKVESETVRQEYEPRETRSSSLGRQAKARLFSRLVRNDQQKTAVRERLAELRRRSAMQFTPGALGKTALGFTAVSFGAQQYGLIEKDPLDLICEEMKVMFSKEIVESRMETNNHSVDDFCFGELIAKGCNAAVYEARLKKAKTYTEPEVVGLNAICGFASSLLSDVAEEEPLHFVDNHFAAECPSVSVERDGFVLLDNMSTTSSVETCIPDTPRNRSPAFDLAVKVMFNYDAESNAAAILQSMEKEAIPARQADVFGDMGTWENGTHVRKKRRLPPHPNIIDMRLVFVDAMPSLSSALQEYPDALPSRIYPNGFGRNMTLFLVMKRYPETLRMYLQRIQPSPETSTLLLAQLLEAVSHLTDHQVAHRDLKTDNILLEFEQDDCPRLVLTDFGCCLCDGKLRIPYNTLEICKGGNAALMAPEINTAQPGPGSVLDYTKSDVWAAGAVGYELFGLANPFYRSNDGYRLDSRHYNENQLPALPEGTSEYVRQVIFRLLRRDPVERPSASVAANMLYLGLWAPSEWIHHTPTRASVVTWLVQLTVEVKCQRLRPKQATMEMILKRMFLSRVNLHDVMLALHFLQQV